MPSPEQRTSRETQRILRGVPEGALELIGWRDCLVWALSEPEILERFRSDTGNRYAAPKSPIEAMIDKACGVDFVWAQAFVDWFNENIWGPSPALAARERAGGER